MKVIPIAMLWLFAFITQGAMGQISSGARGCVVFKPGSEAVASFVEYQYYRDYRSSILVRDTSGAELRVFGGQNPIFIPYPAGSMSISSTTKARIAQAVKTYPEVQPRLAALQAAWIAAARKQPATASRSSKSKKQPVKPKAPPPQTPGGIEIKTRDGEKLRIVGILAVEPDGLKVTTDTGVRKVLFAQLPAEMQKKYGYDPLTAPVAPVAPVAPELDEAAVREKAERAKAAMEEEQRKIATDEAKAAIQRQLEPAVRQGARHIVGKVLKKTDSGVLVVPMNPDTRVRQLPGIPHWNEVSLLKDFPRANEWAEDDRVDVIAVPDRTMEPYMDKIGIRRQAKVFKWVQNPLSEESKEPTP